MRFDAFCIQLEILMKIAPGFSEQAAVAGNTYDKYSSGNPLVKLIMRGFTSSLERIVNDINPSSIHDVGCGEGYWSLRWCAQGRSVQGSDASKTVIDIARHNAIESNLPAYMFSQKSIYDLNAEDDHAELIVCCEVFEHLEEPERALKAVQNISGKHAIFSVPREPLWSALNIARGKYWSDWGNTPGHIQSWSQRDFVQLVSSRFNIIEVSAPTPWTMLLCSPLAAQTRS